MSSAEPTSPQTPRAARMERLFGPVEDWPNTARPARLSLRTALHAMAPDLIEAMFASPRFIPSAGQQALLPPLGELLSWVQAWAEAACTGPEPAVLTLSWRTQLSNRADVDGVAGLMQILRALDEVVLPQLSGAELVRCWLHLDASEAFVTSIAGRRRVVQQGEAIAGAVETDETPAGLVEASHELLRGWAAEAGVLSPTAAQCLFLIRFCREVLMGQSCRVAIWETSLDALQSVLAVSCDDLGPHPLADALAALSGALHRLDMVAGLLAWGPEEEVFGGVTDLLALRVILDAQPDGPLDRAFWRDLDRAALSTRVIADTTRQIVDALAGGWDADALSAIRRAGGVLEEAAGVPANLQRLRMEDVSLPPLPNTEAPLAGASAVVVDLLRAAALSRGSSADGSRRRFNRLVAAALTPEPDDPIWRRSSDLAVAVARRSSDAFALSGLETVLSGLRADPARWLRPSIGPASVLSPESRRLLARAALLDLLDLGPPEPDLLAWMAQDPTPNDLDEPAWEAVITELEGEADPSPGVNARLAGTLRAMLLLAPGALASVHLRHVAPTGATEVATSVGGEEDGSLAPALELLLRRLALALQPATEEARRAYTRSVWTVRGLRHRKDLPLLLRRLLAKLSATLSPGEQAVVQPLLVELFANTLGVTLDNLEVTQDGQGGGNLRWRQIFGAAPFLPPWLSELPAILGRVPEPSAPCNALWGRFLSTLAEQGDLEYAWERAIAALDQGAFDTAQVERSWRVALGQLPDLMPPGPALQVYGLLREGLDVVRQVGLGRRIQASAPGVAAAVMSRPAEREALEATLTQLGQTLATRGTSRALLELGFQLLARGPGDLLLWVEIERQLHDRLDPSERLALGPWWAAIEALVDTFTTLNLPAFHALSRRGDGSSDEAICALLIAAALPERAIRGPRALGERLSLLPPLSGAESAQTWLGRIPDLVSRLGALLSVDRRDGLSEALVALTQSIGVSARITGTSGRSLMTGLALNPHGPWSELHWRALRLATGSSTLGADEPLLAGAGLRMRSARDAELLAAFKEAAGWPATPTAAAPRAGILSWLNRSGAPPPEEEPLDGRGLLVSGVVATLGNLPLDPALAACLNRQNPETFPARMRGLLQTVQARPGVNPLLVEVARALAQRAPEATLAARLMGAAHNLVEPAKKGVRNAEEQTRRADAALVLRRVGLELAGHRAPGNAAAVAARLAAARPGWIKLLEGVPRSDILPAEERPLLEAALTPVLRRAEAGRG